LLGEHQGVNNQILLFLKKKGGIKSGFSNGGRKHVSTISAREKLSEEDKVGKGKVVHSSNLKAEERGRKD